MPSQTVIVGGAALIVGLLLGFLLGRPGYDDPNTKIAALEERVAQAASGTDAVTKAVAALDGRVAEMGERFDAIDSGLGEGLTSVQDNMASGFSAVGETLSAQAEAADARSEGLLSSISGMGEGLTAAIAAAGATAAAAVSTGGDDASAASEEAPQGAVADADAEASPAATAEAAPAEAAESDTETETAAAPAQNDADAPMAASDPARPGETRSLADGEIRAFVSRIDAKAGLASLAVNGLDRMTLAAGRSTEVIGSGGKACLVGLAGITEDGAASVLASCGDDRPAPVGYGAGQTAVMGNTKVFVSKAADGQARVAINGQTLTTLDVGKPVQVEGQRCMLRLECTDRGMADFSSDC